jgi:hypothetical protein
MGRPILLLMTVAATRRRSTAASAHRRDSTRWSGSSSCPPRTRAFLVWAIYLLRTLLAFTVGGLPLFRARFQRRVEPVGGPGDRRGRRTHDRLMRDGRGACASSGRWTIFNWRMQPSLSGWYAFLRRPSAQTTGCGWRTMPGPPKGVGIHEPGSGALSIQSMFALLPLFWYPGLSDVMSGSHYTITAEELYLDRNHPRIGSPRSPAASIDSYRGERPMRSRAIWARDGGARRHPGSRIPHEYPALSVREVDSPTSPRTYAG